MFTAISGLCLSVSRKSRVLEEVILNQLASQLFRAKALATAFENGYGLACRHAGETGNARAGRSGVPREMLRE